MSSSFILPIQEGLSLKELDSLLSPRRFRKADFYMVDLTNLRFLRAPDAINLLILLTHLRQISLGHIQLKVPKSSDVTIAMSEVGFFALAQNVCELIGINQIPRVLPEEELAKRGRMRIRKIERKNLENLRPHSFVSIQNQFVKLTNHNLSFLPQVYLELCRNIWEHSQSFGFFSAQIDNRKNNLYVTVGDLGVGVFESLTPFFNHARETKELRFGPVWDETKALDMAFSPHVSAKYEVKDAGRGLSDLWDFVRRTGGHLVCRSMHSKIYMGYQDGSLVTGRVTDLHELPGTQIEAVFSLETRPDS